MTTALTSTMTYPLDWPEQWPRSTTTRVSSFKTSLAKARDGLIRELHLLGARDVRVTTNMALNRDGTFASHQPGIAGIDQAAAVWFTLRGEDRVLSCDTYRHLEDNLHALELTVGGIRGMQRWGIRDVVDRAMAGFSALPAGDTSAIVGAPPVGHDDPPWHETLHLAPSAGPDLIRAAFRQLAREHHPDRGGDPETFARINRAHERGIAAVS